MSYNDPYAQHSQYAQQQRYQDAPFNPYEVQQQHATQGYEQPGYEQTGYGQPTGYGAGAGYTDDIVVGSKEQPRSEFDDEPSPRAMGEKYVFQALHSLTQLIALL